MADAAARPDPGDLVAALAAAKAALVEAERLATEELIAAKDAHREYQTAETRDRKAAAVAHIQALRAAIRADRGSEPALAGDTFLSPEQHDGAPAVEEG
jgi:hypothetical protein